MPSTSIAEELAKKQREISVSEFFERNKQILGYDSATKALLTVVKEGVDNSVEYSEPVIVRENGWVKLVRIGEFIDAKIRDRFGNAPGSADRDSVLLSGCEVLAYDDTTLKVSFRPATLAHRHTVHGALYEVELTGGRKVTVTGSHSVFALAQGRIMAFRVEDLRIGDYVVVPNREIPLGAGIRDVDLRPWLMSLPDDQARSIMIHGMADRLTNVPRDWKRFDFVPLEYVRSQKLSIPADARINVRFGKSRLPVVLPVTPALMRFLGLYVAEGTRLDATILLSFGSHETALIEETKRLAVQAFGSETRVSSVPAHKTAVCVKLYSKILSWVLRDIFQCGDRARSKRIPDLVFNVPRDLQESFLQGYIDGDGHRGAQKISMSTVSGELADGLSHLLALFGKALSRTKTPAVLRMFPQGHRSLCKDVHNLFVYGNTTPQGQPNSPLFWFPLEETGFRQVVSALNPVNSYNAPLYKDMNSRPHYTVSKFADALQEAEEFAREEIPAELHGQRKFLDRLLFGDVGFLQVRSIRKAKSPHPFVYDFTVPGYEKFLGGRGVIFLHNTLDA